MQLLSKRWLVGLVAFFVLIVGITALSRAHQAAQERRTAAQVAATNKANDAVRRRDPRPNIVMVLMDDADYSLLHTMRNGREMQKLGATYVNSHVVDSLCCPSRTSIFTGRPPHLTGVRTNTAGSGSTPLGGFAAFAAHDNAQRSFAIPLHQAGYTTAFIGKYINGYDTSRSGGKLVAPPRQPGWSDFGAVLSGGYHEWGFYSVAQKKGKSALQLVKNSKPPRSSSVATLDAHYATNVMAVHALDFLAKHRHSPKPYFLEVATYGPHAQLKKAYPGIPPYPSSFRDREPKGDPTGGNCGVPCGSLTLGDLAGYGADRAADRPDFLLPHGRTRPAPPWNKAPVTLTATNALKSYRDRARMVQSIDRMLGKIRRAVGPNTYVILTSDNGYHLGQLDLNGGKGTPYDFDTRVPLVVTGPGVVPGVRQQWVSNIDLAPTFETLAGLKPDDGVAGLSFADSLQHPTATDGRYVFFDHTYAPPGKGEVDGDTAVGGDIQGIPSYIGVRGKQGLLVRFDLSADPATHRYAWELYNADQYRVDGFEKTNVFAQDHDKPWARTLMKRLLMWDDCQPLACRAAAR